MTNTSARARSRRRTLRGAIALATTTATLLGITVVGSASAQASSRVAFDGAVPAFARHANDVGAAPVGATQQGQVYLKLRNAASAETVARAVSTPTSSAFRKYKTPAQWMAAFSPTQSSVDQVTGYLRSKGLTVTAVPTSRLYVVFRGSTTAMNAAFGTSIHRYSVDAKTVTAPSTTPTLPASVAGIVDGISIDQARLLSRPNLATRSTGAAVAEPATGILRSSPKAATVTPKLSSVLSTPCSSYSNRNLVTVPAAYGTTKVSTPNCGYTPAQLRTSTGSAGFTRAGYTGAGQTVAIVDAFASPTIVADVNTWADRLREPRLTSATYQQIVPKPSQFTDLKACGYPSGWQGEQTMDVQAVHAIAPKAKVLYVGATDCGGGMDVALSKILDGRLATIVSNSYGGVGETLSPDAVQGQVNLQLQAAAEGILLAYASGDDGDQYLNLKRASPDFPASSPWVTAIGGTSLGVTKTGTKAYEVGWGNTLAPIVVSNGRLAYGAALPGKIFAGGAGGGRSALFAQPAYQRGTVPSALTSSKPKRVSPDVAALADPYTGMLSGIRGITNDSTLATGAYSESVAGGTSLATPLFAAQMAVLQQYTKKTFGFVNPTLYGAHASTPAVFNDVKPATTPKALVYTNRGATHLVSLDRDSSLRTARGYDNVTGLGTLSMSNLSHLVSGR